MKTRVAAVIALALGAMATTSSAFAQPSLYRNGQQRETAYTGYLGVHDGPFYERCAMSSAAEGNANQQTRPVKQYGQTSGGYRC